MKEIKVKTTTVRLDQYEWSMLNNLTKIYKMNRSKLIRFLIEKEYIEQNEKENW